MFDRSSQNRVGRDPITSREIEYQESKPEVF